MGIIKILRETPLCSFKSPSTKRASYPDSCCDWFLKKSDFQNDKIFKIQIAEVLNLGEKN